MGFFRAVYLAIQNIFGLSVTKRSEFCSADIRDIPAFVPPAPRPVGELGSRYKPKKPSFLDLEYTVYGDVAVLKCRERARFRETTRAINKVCTAFRRGIGHKPHVREREIIIHGKDLPVIRLAMVGASYHELRKLAT